MAALLLLGPRFAPVVFVVLLASGHLFGSAPLPHLLLPALALVLVQSAAAYGLNQSLHRRDFYSLQPLVRFALTLLSAALLGAVLASGSYVLTGLAPFTAWAEALLFRSLGDVVAMLAVTPLVLIVLAPRLPDRYFGPEVLLRVLPPLRPLPTATAVLELAILIGTLGAALFFPHLVPLYLALLPLLWIAVRHGLPRTALAVFLVLVGAATLLPLPGSAAPPLGTVQLFAATLALTGLAVGGLVTERERALVSLRRACAHLTTRLEQRDAALLAEISQRQQAESILGWYVGQLRQERDAATAHSDKHATLSSLFGASARHLRALNARKDMLFALVAHDVKNLLTGAVGYSELLERDADAMPRPIVREFAAYIHRSTRSTYETLENLQAWALLQADRLPFRPEPLVLHDQAAELLALYADRAHAKGIALHNEVPSDLAALADPTMLRSILQNLVSNAIKFTERGGAVTVSGRHTEGHVLLHVEDTGIGMAPEYLEKLLSDHERPPSQPGTDAEPGSGLGLVLCRELATRQGGALRARSTPGEGTVFEILLPTAEGAEASTSPRSSLRSQPLASG